MEECEKEGIDVFPIETYRSAERQDRLFKQSPKVTNARGYESLHNYGWACDFGVRKDDGTLDWNTKGENWIKFVKIARKYFTCGADWGDYGHVSLNPLVELTGNTKYKTKSEGALILKKKFQKLEWI